MSDQKETIAAYENLIKRKEKDLEEFREHLRKLKGEVES